MIKRGYAYYLKEHDTYKDMLQKVTTDLCDKELSIASKEILCAIGKKLKKHVEYLQEVLAGCTPPEDD